MKPAHHAWPKHSAKKWRMPVLTAQEARGLFASIETSVVLGSRDRALIGTMTCTFVRVGKAPDKMRVEDVYLFSTAAGNRARSPGARCASRTFTA